jgi:hypothetical protein
MWQLSVARAVAGFVRRHRMSTVAHLAEYAVDPSG